MILIQSGRFNINFAREQVNNLKLIETGAMLHTYSHVYSFQYVVV